MLCRVLVSTVFGQFISHSSSFAVPFSFLDNRSPTPLKVVKARLRRCRANLTRLFVRNIDLPEALVFYGVLEQGDWTSLVKQCQECGTATIVVDKSRHKLDDKNALLDRIALWTEASVNPPNPKDLCYSLKSTTIQPKPFGGSSGFGASQAVDPPRSPLPSRTVVIASTAQHSQAARYAGMRVVSLDDSDDLADAVLTIEEIQDLWLEDLATPGSFWLNPPHPRDEQGNRVDPEHVIANLASQGSNPDMSIDWNKEGIYSVQDIDDEELQRILTDLSPL